MPSLAYVSGFNVVSHLNHSSRDSDGHGYWLQPVKVSGNNTRANMTLIRCGATIVPSVSPIADPANAPRTRTKTNNGTPDARQGIEPSTNTPTGNITIDATRARVAAKTSFSIATQLVGSGASRRSSISLVPENSITNGSAVLWMLVNMAV